MRGKLWLLVVTSLLILTSCEIEVPGGGFLTATPAETGPTPTPVIIGQPEVKPTDTPVPMPPTPTPRPTATPVVGETPAATTQPASDMVLIPAGPFIMGSDADDRDEAPQREVDLPAFEIDLFEVTNAQFAAFVAATGYKTDAEKAGEPGWRGFYTEGKDNHPVVKVSWNDAVAYCQWLGKRLPTEAEWEKAARGTDGRIYPWGNEWDPARLNSYQSGYRGTTPVGSFAEGVSPYGVFDMAGNVWEWTADWYLPYPGSDYQDPYFGEVNKVTRGGGWFEEPPQVRTSNRNCTSPTAANDDLGFRCAR
ncbi:MAG: formylglycine-generating enzyme family protein [Anaerolineae bacterium]|jgi:formylglycine-generating enzyme required for sulfatase activity|nr:formylglycine-generating enzyme family protein [Anaerolineae bacterium]MDH7473446.1 formylglycine-generating enzyme family protein [Anaerolineae bacterium]